MGKRFYIVLALMILTGIYTKYFMFEAAVSANVLKNFPQMIGEWQGLADHKFNDEVIKILKLDDYLNRDFFNGEKRISLYIGYYKTHRSFAEIHTPEHCQAGGGWEILKERKRELDINGVDKKINFIEAVYEKNKEKQVFLYWYQINGKYITNFFLYKLNVIMKSIIHHRSDAAFVRISIPVINDNVEDALRTGEGFLKDFVPVMDKFLQHV
ncbi:MAG: exosortase C-terminal domain/associated protein EpsI [candidate division WOR-3 bacterium]